MSKEAIIGPALEQLDLDVVGIAFMVGYGGGVPSAWVDNGAPDDVDALKSIICKDPEDALLWRTAYDSGVTWYCREEIDASDPECPSIFADTN